LGFTAKADSCVGGVLDVLLRALRINNGKQLKDENNSFKALPHHQLVNSTMCLIVALTFRPAT
jgi:hypothetical protein